MTENPNNDITKGLRQGASSGRKADGVPSEASKALTRALQQTTIVDPQTGTPVNGPRTMAPVKGGIYGVEPLNKYDAGFIEGMDQNLNRRQNQNFWQMAGNFVTNVGAEIVGGSIEGLGYLLDFEQHLNMLKGQEQEFGNWFSDIGKSLKEGALEEFPIYQYQPGTFNPGDAGWWFSNGVSIASTFSLMIPAIGAVRAVSGIGQGLRLMKSVEKLSAAGVKTRRIAEGITGAVYSRQMENTMEASQVFESVYQSKMAEGMTDEKAREVAGEAAQKSWNANWVNLVFDIPQYLFAFRKSDELRALITGTANQNTKKKVLGDVAQSMLQEGAEEAVQFITAAEAEASADGKEFFGEGFTERLGDYLRDGELWTASFFGAIGGGIFAGAAPVYDRMLKRNKAIGEAAMAGDEVSADAMREMDVSSVAWNRAMKTGSFDSVKEEIETLANEAGVDPSNYMEPINLMESLYNKGKKEGKPIEEVASEIEAKVKINIAERAYKRAKEETAAAENKEKEAVDPDNKFSPEEKNIAFQKRKLKEEIKALDSIISKAKKAKTPNFDIFKDIADKRKKEIDSEFAELDKQVKENKYRTKIPANSLEDISKDAIYKETKQRVLKEYDLIRANNKEIQEREAAQMQDAYLNELKDTLARKASDKSKSMSEELLQDVVKQAKLTLGNSFNDKTEAAIVKEFEAARNNAAEVEEETAPNFDPNNPTKRYEGRPNLLAKELEEMGYESLQELVEANKPQTEGRDSGKGSQDKRSNQEDTLPEKQTTEEYFDTKKEKKNKKEEKESIENEDTDTSPVIEEYTPNSSKQSSEPSISNADGDLYLHDPFNTVVNDMCTILYNPGNDTFNIYGSNPSNISSITSKGITSAYNIPRSTFNKYFKVPYELHPNYYYVLKTKDNNPVPSTYKDIPVDLDFVRTRLNEVKKVYLEIDPNNDFRKNAADVAIMTVHYKDGNPSNKSKDNRVVLGTLNAQSKAFGKKEGLFVALRRDIFNGYTEHTMNNNSGIYTYPYTLEVEALLPGRFWNTSTLNNPNDVLPAGKKLELAVGVTKNGETVLNYNAEEIGPRSISYSRKSITPGGVYMLITDLNGNIYPYRLFTKKLKEMPKLVEEIKSLFKQLNKENWKDIRASVREIVRYKTEDGKIMPDFNEKILNLYKDKDGNFDVDTYFEATGLLEKPVQIDSKLINKGNYNNVVSDRMQTDVNPVQHFHSPKLKLSETANPIPNFKKLVSKQVPTTSQKNPFEEVDSAQKVDLIESSTFVDRTAEKTKGYRPILIGNKGASGYHTVWGKDVEIEGAQDAVVVKYKDGYRIYSTYSNEFLHEGTKKTIAAAKKLSEKNLKSPKAVETKNDPELENRAEEQASTVTYTEEISESGQDAQKEIDKLKKELEELKLFKEQLIKDIKNPSKQVINKVFEDHVTEEEIAEVSEELGTDNVEVVKEEVRKRVTEELNNKSTEPVRKDSAVKRLVAKIKKLLLAMFITASFFSNVSFRSPVSDNVITYSEVRIENLDSWNDAYQTARDLNNTDNINIINTYHENIEGKYIIVDKAAGLAHLHERGQLITTYEVGTGKIIGDDQTITTADYYDSKGNKVTANQALDSKGNIRDGYTLHTNWQEGNRQTGAGIYTVNSVGTYAKQPAFFMDNARGIRVPTALHVTNRSRVRLFNDNDPSNNRMSYGCVNFLAKDINELAKTDFGQGNNIYILPDDTSNHFKLIDGKLVFESKSPNVNRSVKSRTAPESIHIETSGTINDDVREFLQGVADAKSSLMDIYPTISNDEYNMIAQLAYGIMGKESSFGTYGTRGQIGRAGDIVQTARGKSASVGVGQVRLTSLKSEVRDIFDIGKQSDLFDVRTNAAATMAILIDNYVNMMPYEIHSNPEAAMYLLPISYNNHTAFKEAAKEYLTSGKIESNYYSDKVTEWAKQTTVYTGDIQKKSGTSKDTSENNLPSGLLLSMLPAFIKRRKSGEAPNSILKDVDNRIQALEERLKELENSLPKEDRVVEQKTFSRSRTRKFKLSNTNKLKNNISLEEADKWWKNNLPNVPLHILEDLKNIHNQDVDALGVFMNAAAYVVNHADGSVAYHEAFHAVFTLFLTPKQQTQILTEAYNKYGKKLGISEQEFEAAILAKNFNETSSKFKIDTQIAYELKAAEILSSDRAEKIFAKGKKNNWSLDKTLTELQIPKEQKQIILDKGLNNIEDIITSLLAIQDSVRKGYEKVMFPKGDTAAKIEGHETLEDFIDNKESRLKYLKRIVGYKVVTLEEAGLTRETSPLISGDYILEETYENGSVGHSYRNTYFSREEAQKKLEFISAKDAREIKQLEKEIADAKAGKLKISSIANFYEVTIANILSKKGYKPVEVTDEYGNKWNEITLDENVKSKVSTVKLKTESDEFYKRQGPLARLEEELADDLAEFIATKTVPKSLGDKIKAFFTRLLDFINNTLGNRLTIERLFRNIDRGVYSKRSPLVQSKVTDPRYKIPEGFTPETLNRRVNSALMLFDEIVSAELAKNPDISPKKLYKSLLSSDVLENRITSPVKESVFTYIADHYRNIYDSGKMTPELDNALTKFMNGIVYEENGVWKPGELYFEIVRGLSSRGITIQLNRDFEVSNVEESELGKSDVEEDAINTNEEESYSEAWAIKSMSISPKEKLTFRLKRWLNNINEVDKDGNVVYDDTAFEVNVNPNIMYADLQATVGGSISSSDMMDKIQQKAIENPVYLQIQSDLENNALLKTQLFNIAQKVHPSFMVLLQVGSTFNLINANRSSKKFAVLADLYDSYVFTNTSNTKVDRLQSIVEQVKDNIANKPIAVISDTNLINKIKGQLETDGLKIPNDVIIRLNKSGNLARLIGAKGNFTALNSYYKAISNNVDPFNSEEYSSDMVKLADLISSGYLNTYQDSHINLDGERVYEWINSSYFGRLIDRLRNEESYAAWADFNSSDPFYRYSPIFRDLKSKSFREGLEFVVFEGSKKKGLDSGVPYSNMSKKDFLSLIINSYYNSGSDRAYYNLPILSDAPILAGISLPKYKKIEIGSSVEASVLDDLYNVVMQDYYKSSLDDGNKIKNYDKNKFSFFPFLQGTDVTNSVATKKKLKAHLDQKFEDFLLNLIDLGMIYETSEGGIFIPDSYDRSIDIRIGEDARAFLREFYYNYVLAQSQIITLTTGDAGFYKNGRDFFKRAKEIWSPGSYLDIAAEWNDIKVRPTYNVGIVKDVEVPSDMIESIFNALVKSGASEKEARDIANKYSEVSITDAQSYVDIFKYREEEIGLGRWSDEKQAAFDNIVQGKPVTNGVIFQPVKPFYYGKLKVNGRVVPVQNKDSQYLLTPIMAKGNPRLEKILESMGYTFNGDGTVSFDEEGRMANKYLDKAVFNTGIKVGEHGTFSSVEDLADRSKGIYHEFSNSDWRLQQETPEHHLDTDNIFGTQIMKLMQGDVDNNSNYVLPNKEKILGRELKKRYNDLIIRDIQESYSDIASRLTDLDSIIQVIRDEVINRGLGDQYLEALEKTYNEVLDEVTTALPLYHPVQSYRIESMLNSLFKKSVTRQKFNSGGSFINLSSFGIEDKPKIKLNEETGAVEYLEAYITPWSNKIFKPYIDDQGNIDIDKINKENPDLLHGIVYRIPTEDKYSMIHIKVKGFLPAEAGGAIVLPDEITRIAGLDFDVDKVNAFFYSPNKEGKILRGDTSKAASDNEKLDIMRSILSDPKTAKSILDPGGFDEIVANNKIIEDAKGRTNKNIDILDPSDIAEVANDMNVGKQLVGIAANHNAVHPIWQQYPIEINPFFGFKFNDKLHNSLNLYEDLEGRRLVTRNISENLAAFVDNGKQPEAYKYNMNIYTADVGFAMLHAGVPLKTVQFFLAQPVLESLSRKYFVYGATLQAERKALADISAALGESFTLNPVPSELLSGFSETELEKALSDSLTSAFQKEVLKAFLAYKSVGAAVSKLVSATKVSDTGVGPTLAHTIQRIRVRNSDVSKIILGADTMFQGYNFNNTLYQVGVLQSADKITEAGGFPDLRTGSFNTLLDYITKSFKDNELSVNETNQVYRAYIDYLVSKDDNFSKEDLEDFVYNMPDRLSEFKAMISDYSIFTDRLHITTINEETGLQAILFKGVVGTDASQINDIRRAWQEMLYDDREDVRQFAKDLVKYSFYRSGYQFTTRGFSHLIPVSYYTKTDEGNSINNTVISQIIDAKDDKDMITVYPFVDQFIRNYYKDLYYIPEISQDREVPTFNRVMKKGVPAALVPKDLDFFKTREGVVFPYIKHEDKLYRMTKTEAGKPYYTLVSDMGINGFFVEYNYRVNNSDSALNDNIPKTTLSFGEDTTSAKDKLKNNGNITETDC